MPARHSSFDVAVLGGGPAGSVTALLLARAGASVILLEASDYRDARLGETLPPLINPLLGHLELTNRFSAQRPSASEGVISIWGQGRPSISDFMFDVHGYGWRIDRARFDRMLADSAADAGAEVRLARVVSCGRSRSAGWSVTFETAQRTASCEAAFLVDATGRSGTAGLSQLSPKTVYDRLIGVAWFGGCTADEPHALIESVDEGWFYSAAMPDGRVAIVYMTDSDLYRRGCARYQDYWFKQLAKTTMTRRRFAPRESRAALRIQSAASILCRKPTDQGWLAVGDAAMSFDPLSGLGVYRALEGASIAATTIEDVLSRGGSSGSPSNNVSYDRWIRRTFAEYLGLRRHHYTAEQRWPDSTFWRRRHEPLHPSESVKSRMGARTSSIRASSSS
ncbi:MAG TPA: NAD(P)/FAD-dependent oxidoreductase [Vicinamibacterales bacterium]|nr:NAD(P)/FAD-dependent oxidoreductase [Vicinamibacterales bacterium]